MSKNINKWLISFLLLACCFWVGVKLDTARWTQKAINMQKQVEKKQSQYNNKVSRLRYQVEQDNANSKNPKIKSVSIQNGSEALITSMGTRFFKKIYTWDSASSYSSHHREAEQYVSGDLLKDKSLFGDKHVSDMINNTGLVSQFNNAKFWIESADGKTITAIATVNYQQNYSGSPTGTGIRTYELTYDQSQQKFTKINLIQNSIES